MSINEKFRKILKNKMVRFILRFMVHLLSMLSVSFLVTKFYFDITSFNDLLLIQKEFIWLSISAAFITSLIGHKFQT